MVIPLGCVYRPLAQQCLEIQRDPITCKACGGILNPFCQVNGANYSCPFCRQRDTLPNLGVFPPEATQGNETVEYVMPAQRPPATFVFVIDTCLDTEEEMEGLRQFLLETLERLPEYANIVFITFGSAVQIHDLSGRFSYPRATVLRGSHEVTVKLLDELVPDLHPYVVARSTGYETLQGLIQNLTMDLWPVMKDYRALRCTGAALSAAASILQKVAPNTGSCILTFLSGACTTGPGIVVETSREHLIRTHNDIRDGTQAARHFSSSCTFYDTLMRRIVAQGHSLNVFAASLDQLGIAEMKICIQSSGGVVLNAESWHQQPFRNSLYYFFKQRENGSLMAGFNATFDVITCPTWKVQGVIGECVGTGKKSTSVAESEVGLGGTCQWTSCMIDETTSFAIYYDTVTGPQGCENNQVRYTQIITRYETGFEKRTRVSTLTVGRVMKPTIQQLTVAFDQETAAVLLARQALYKTDTLPPLEVLRWLDRTVLRLVRKFAQYTKNDPHSLRLPNEFTLFPQFMYHLRRSGYLNVFNSSPDESSILRLQLLKSCVEDSMTQIQPALYSYTLEGAPEPVSLDSSAIKPDNILILDTFFEVLIHYGSTIAEWRRAGYADQEDYAYFRDFLEVPMNDAQTIASARYPTPRLIDVCQNDPDSRILYNRINPSKTYVQMDQTTSNTPNTGDLVYTDDTSLEAFTAHLKKLAVSE
ncbi:protein transport protein SEC23 [Angomonas deanei]|uniref:Protein transport protein SEC23 n=1 Tax=Angomonas deanei TaxID=59799 RepID=A0A7G2C0F4_9TRYP|nr:protein transport protein SEC23 [Angomonas deanei]CAD2213268.1 Sec23/Sec24 zinc finger/Sec23/Sec24 trunk domain/Sec23/Sec24 beta-sandwich domain/Sec23/Sec24 helical domain/Gelsolin repeat, putative [Angomonas deanei]|eukprot:EPY27167.1 protein transport protein SEC23 [Angomonas deanei]